MNKCCLNDRFELINVDFEIQFVKIYVYAMHSSVPVSVFSWFFLLRLVSVTVMVLGLTACQVASSHKVSSLEFVPFNAMPAQYRIMNQVRINWEVRDDVAHFCSHAKSMGREQSYLTPPMACAIWDIPKAECTVVTGPLTSHVALGHELRHCFEGHFHR
jgi:hypothetical protein